MGNKQPGARIKAAFQNLGHKIESGFRTVYDKALVPVFEKVIRPVYEKVAPLAERIGGRLLKTGENALGLVDHTLEVAAKTEDAATDFLSAFSKPWLLYPALIVGGLIVYRLVDSKKG
jgi:hypothetical protein